MVMSGTNDSPLGIVAGRGPLPLAVAHAARAKGRCVFMVAVEGETEGVEDFPHKWVRVGALGSTIEALKKAGCRDLVMIGPMSRPTLRTFRPDWGAFRVLAQIVRLLRKGDDGLLSGIVQYFEDEHGFNILAAEEVAEDMVAPGGLLTKSAPGETALRDIDLAITEVRARGQRDLGQGAVARSGEIVAVEKEDGTDAMLRRIQPDRSASGSRSGVLVKLPKQGQERRIDLPTIGLTTVDNAAAAGLEGIAYEAAGALIADVKEVAEEADRLGLFVIGLPEGTGEGTAS